MNTNRHNSFRIHYDKNGYAYPVNTGISLFKVDEPRWLWDIEKNEKVYFPLEVHEPEWKVILDDFLCKSIQLPGKPLFVDKGKDA